MEYTVGQLSTKLESRAIAKNSDAASLSQFEKLHSEVVLAIFARAPEAVSNLRLVFFFIYLYLYCFRGKSGCKIKNTCAKKVSFQTSRALRGLVDEFVRQRTTIPLVHQIQIIDRFNRNYSNDVSLLTADFHHKCTKGCTR